MAAQTAACGNGILTSRIYVSSPLRLGELITLNEAASHHLLTVLRKPIGADLQIFNGQGGFYKAYLHEIRKKCAVIFLKEWIDEERESPLQIHLGQGISRGERMDFAVQKSVELGVHAITPLITERCGVQLKAERSQNRVQHWQKIAISASEQCGRCRVPVISASQNFNEFLSHSADLKIICGFFETTPPIPNLIKAPCTINLLIGPEGGFSPVEMEQALQNDFIPFSLGPRILRTETAALIAITLLQARWGDLPAIAV